MTDKNTVREFPKSSGSTKSDEHQPKNKKTKATRPPKKQPKFIARKIPLKTLGLTPDYLPKSILEVTKKLNKAGFDAYIVGGGVRDALLGNTPKDFDAVTNAKPNEIKEVFGKRCRIIGRRFQLAHVYSGQDMIEVATFRAPPKHKSAVNHTGMLVRDNVWGTIEQDFARRDFTINALYLDPHKKVVIDFCNTIDDIKAKKLTFLGDAQTRVEEDPVRLLRALRFTAKLGLRMDDAITQCFTHENWLHLQTVSPHRLYDESLKIFGGGYVSQVLPLLEEYNALNYLFAEKIDEIEPLVQSVAESTDNRIRIGKSINPAFFYAALLYPAFLVKTEQLSKKLSKIEAMNSAGIKVLANQRHITAMPRFAENFVRETWNLQPRLIKPKPKQINRIVEHSRFRAAFDFLLLREQSGDTNTNGMGKWWQTFQTLDAQQRESAIQQLQRQQLQKRIETVALDETAICAPNKTLAKIPQSKQSANNRKRVTRNKTSQNKKPMVHQHILADVIRGDKPETID